MNYDLETANASHISYHIIYHIITNQSHSAPLTFQTFSQCHVVVKPEGQDIGYRLQTIDYRALLYTN